MTQRRNRNIERLKCETFDVLVLGAGINGAVSAAALSAHGAKVALIDERDFAGFTSQHSSNLIWGGIKYLENGELGLVNKLCQSRNELMKCYPSSVREIRFLLTLAKTARLPAWMMQTGAWLYWLLGRGYTRSPCGLSPTEIEAIEPVIDMRGSRGGIEYSDAYLYGNDARFVFGFVKRAMKIGCVAVNYARSIAAQRSDDGVWQVELEDVEGEETFQARARVIINATGAYVDQHNHRIGVRTEHHHVFSKGIHLIVPALSQADRVLSFFADDGRLFFAIPMGHRTCIGTTDLLVDSPKTSVTDADRAFVLSNINARLRLNKPLGVGDIISERCGVRPLAVKKGQQPEGSFMRMSRKHVIETDAPQRYISIFGGKLTDCLNMGSGVCRAVEGLGVSLRAPEKKWYGEPEESVRAAYFRQARQLGIHQRVAEDTGEPLSERLWRRYGEDATAMLTAITHDPAQADCVIEGAGLRHCELGYLAEHEMIVKLDDVLRRRTMLAQVMRREALERSEGLRALCAALFADAAAARYDEYFQRHGVQPVKQSTN